MNILFIYPNISHQEAISTGLAYISGYLKKKYNNHNIKLFDFTWGEKPQALYKLIKEFKPKVVALSGFLTLAFDSMKEIIKKIVDSGLRDTVKIMIGGGTVDKNIVDYVKADAFGESAVDAVNIAKNWMEG